MRCVLGRVVLFAILVMAVSPSANANDWADYATVSMTDPLTPKLAANRLCYSDGRDLLCDGAAGLLTTSGTIQVPSLVAGSIGTGNIAASGNVSLSGVIKVGTTGATCASGISGTMRYNTASSTMEYCNGSAWANMGPSSTQPVSFSVYKSGNQTAGSFIQLTFDRVSFDTNNNFSTATSRFTPTVPGKYLFRAQTHCASGGNCQVEIFKNGTVAVYGPMIAMAGERSVATIILDMNGSTDYVQANGYSSNGTSDSFYGGNELQTSFSGVLLSAQGSGSGGGTATPAGSTADVQFNSGGALSADTGLFTYGGGVLKAPTVSASNLYGSSISATTATIGSIGTGNIAASGNVSITGVIKVGTTAATCASSISGTMRYNTASNTMEYCNGSAWANMGPSATTPVAFSVNKGGSDQSISNATSTKLTWSTKRFDTNNNFAGDRFSPTVPGKYLVHLSIACNSPGNDCIAYIYKNGASYSIGESYNSTGTAGWYAATTAIIDMNGTTDYLEAYAYVNSGGTIYGLTDRTHFEGALLSSQGGGSGGGTATPAGSTSDIQFNSSGALAADSGNLTYASGVLKAPAVSASSIQFGGTGSESCSSAADYGKMRRNPTSGRPQVCLPR